MIGGKPDIDHERIVRAGDGDGKGSLFRGLLDLIPTTVIVVRGYRIIFVNKAAEAGTGYSRDELMAMNFWNIVHPDHRAPTKRLARELLKGKETPTHAELKVVSKDGAEKWVELRAICTAIDNRPAIITSVMETTDRKNMEEELKTHRDRLNTLVEDRTKEIAEISGIAPSSVDSHRNAIRKKLGLNSKKVNLRSYLLTLR